MKTFDYYFEHIHIKIILLKYNHFYNFFIYYKKLLKAV